jgi:hypothetical protein
MKHFIIVLLLVPFFGFAQDCKLKKGIDPITSKPTLSTGFIDLPGATLSIDINNKEIDFFFVMSATNAKCLDENTEAEVVFEGGKAKQEIKTAYKNSGSMNCDGIFHIIFKNSQFTPSPLQKLAAKKVLAIRLKGSTPKPIEMNLTPELQQTFMNVVSCVIKEAKTVL